FVTVTADMIEGTITATLLNRLNPEAIESRRQAAGKLYTVDEFAEEIAALVGRDDLEVGHVEYVGGAKDYFEQLNAKYAISSQIWRRLPGAIFGETLGRVLHNFSKRLVHNRKTS